MNYPLKEILPIFENAQVEGNIEIELSSIASLEKATQSDLSFLGNKKYSSEVPNTKAGAVLLPHSYKGALPENSTIIRVEDPSKELAKLGELIEKILWPKKDPSIHPSAVIDESAKIGKDVFIGANVIISQGAVIGDGCVLEGNNYIGRYVKIGEESVLYPNSLVMDYCILGKRVRLQPAALIGSEGYGYVFVDGKHQKVPQIGKVILEDDVEIGSNTCIDRARFDTTLIGEGTKIDNLVQIAHNVQVGKSALIVSQVGISGSTSVGNYAVLGGQVGVAGHLKIGDGAMIGGQSGINGNVEPKAYLRGTPAHPFMKAHKLDILTSHLPELFDRVKELEKAAGISNKTFGQKK